MFANEVLCSQPGMLSVPNYPLSYNVQQTMTPQMAMLQQLTGLPSPSLAGLRDLYWSQSFIDPRLFTYIHDDHIKVSVHKNHIWEHFKNVTTEMIVTKNGRRMFPTIEINATGLEKNTQYYVLLEIVPLDNNKYRHNGKNWLVAGKAELHVQRVVTHADSPAPGYHWMNNPISFSKIKLTNNNMDNNGNIILNSMQKYRIQVHFMAQRPYTRELIRVGTFELKIMDFVAVTAYQYDRITDLKIKLNPFAKGFRNKPRKKARNAATKVDLEEKEDLEDDYNEDFDIDVVNPFTPAPIENQDPCPILPLPSSVTEITCSSDPQEELAYTTSGITSSISTPCSDTISSTSLQSSISQTSSIYSSSLSSNPLSVSSNLFSNTLHSPQSHVTSSSLRLNGLHPSGVSPSAFSSSVANIERTPLQKSTPFPTSTQTGLGKQDYGLDLRIESLQSNASMRSLCQYYFPGDKGLSASDRSINSKEAFKNQTFAFHPYRSPVMNFHSQFYSTPQFVHH